MALVEFMIAAEDDKPIEPRIVLKADLVGVPSKGDLVAVHNHAFEVIAVGWKIECARSVQPPSAQFSVTVQVVPVEPLPADFFASLAPGSPAAKQAPVTAAPTQVKPAQELTDAQLSIKAEARRIGIDTAVKGWLPAIIRYLAEWGYEALAPLTAVSPASLTAAQLAAVEEAMGTYNRAPDAPPLPNQNPFADETLSDAPMPDGRKLAEAGASTNDTNRRDGRGH